MKCGQSVGINRNYGFGRIRMLPQHPLDRIPRAPARPPSQNLRNGLGSQRLGALERSDGAEPLAKHRLDILLVHVVEQHPDMPCNSGCYFVLIPISRANQGSMTADEQLRRFGERLREARVLAACNQQEFAALGGVKKNSQLSYETGKIAPTIEYLYRLARHGIDIGYLLTGRSDGGGQGVAERHLTDMFGQLGARERDAILAMLAILTGNAARAGEGVPERLSRTVHAPRQDFAGENDR